MQKNHLVSVLVPVYNAEAYVKECLDSIVNQTYENLEIILVDDGSTDNSLAICKVFAESDSRIKLFTQLNKGVLVTRGVLLSKISGHFFSFIDADDFYEPNAIEILLRLILKNDADLSKGSFRTVTMQGTAISECISISNNFNNYEYMEFLLNGNWSLWGSLIRFNKNHIEQFAFDKNVTVGEDLMISTQLAINIKKAIISDKNIYNYRKGLETLMSAKDRMGFLSDQFLSVFHTYTIIKDCEKYRDLTINLIGPAIYNYVYFFDKNIYHNELLQMTRYLAKNRHKVRGGQFKFILTTLKFSYNLSHLSVLGMQKIKPTIKIFNSNIKV
jgi:glycosyltransferase involved in cell wall biosynthesis